MSSHKMYRGHDRNKRHEVAQESQQLRRDVENLENALMLHYRYQSETENSVRGMIRNEIAGSRWEHGGEGKLTTYRSNKDLIQQDAGHLRAGQGKKIRTSRRDIIDTGQPGKKSDRPATASQTLESKKSGQRVTSQDRQEHKETSVKYKEVPKVRAECDKANWKKLDPATTWVISSDRQLNKKDDRPNPESREPNTRSIKHLKNEDRYDRNDTSGSSAVKDKKSAQATAQVMRRSASATSPVPDAHFITAEVSRPFHKFDGGFASPVASLETSYSFSSPTKTSADKSSSDQVLDSYGKTLEFLMSQFNTSQQKTGRRSDSAVPSDQHEISKHHRRHTAGGNSNRWADSTQGVSYLASKTWRYGPDDFYCDEMVQRSASTRSLEKSDRHLPQSPENRGAHSARSQHSSSHGSSINNKPFQSFSGSKSSPLILVNRLDSPSTALLPSSPTSYAPAAATLTSPAAVPQTAPAVGGSIYPLVGHNSRNSHPGFSLFSHSSVTSHTTPQPTVITVRPFSSVLSDRPTLAQTTQEPPPDTGTVAITKPKTLCAPDVVSWLSGLGLHSVDDYVQLFSEHEMDMASIKLLTTTTLRDMGINALGPIMKIMKGVEVLHRGERSSSSKETSTQHSSNDNDTDNQKPSEWECKEEALDKCDQNNASSQKLVTEEKPVNSAACNDRSTEEKLKPNSDPSQNDASLKLHQEDRCLTEREPKNGTETSRVSRKSGKGRGKMSKVTGKPPPVGRLVDDGIAHAAQKYSAKQQQQWQRQQAVEKNATQRKQMRDEMAAKHTLRRSASMDRTTNMKRKPTGLERSASFTSLKTVSDVPQISDIMTTKQLARDQGDIEFRRSAEALSRQTVGGPVTIISPLGDSTKDTTSTSRAEHLTMGIPHPKQKNPTHHYSPRPHPLEGITGSGTHHYSPRPHPLEGITGSGHDEILGIHVRKTPSRNSCTSSDDESSPHVSASRRRTARERRRQRAAMGWVGDEDGEGLVLSPSVMTRELEKGVPLRRSMSAVKALGVDTKSPPPMSTGSTSETAGRNGPEDVFESDRVFRDPGAELTREAIPAQTVPPVKNLGHFKPAPISRPGLLSTGFHIENLKKVELHRQAIDFSENDLLGDNVYSQVFKGSYQHTEVAVKRLKAPLQPRDRNYFAAEVSMFEELCHSNVVQLIGVCTTDKLPLVVLEYMVLGNLHNWLHDPSRTALEHKQFYQIARDVSAGMLYLHQRQPPVLHLNLNSCNVLLGQGLHAKVADFGFSKLKHEADHKVTRGNNKTKQIQGNTAWMAPELLTGSDVIAKADVYSFAVVLWEMLTRKTPYDGMTVYQILENVRVNKRPPISGSCPAELTKLIQRSWDPNPAVRPGFKELLKTFHSVSDSLLWRIEPSAPQLNTDTTSIKSQGSSAPQINTDTTDIKYQGSSAPQINTDTTSIKSQGSSAPQINTDTTSIKSQGSSAPQINTDTTSIKSQGSSAPQINTDTTDIKSQGDENITNAWRVTKLQHDGKSGDAESKLEMKSISSESENDSSGESDSSGDDGSDFISVTPVSSSSWTISNTLDYGSTKADNTQNKLLYNRTSSKLGNTFVNNSSASDISSGTAFQPQTPTSDISSAKSLPKKTTFPTTPGNGDHKSVDEIFDKRQSEHKSTDIKTTLPHHVDSQPTSTEPLDLTVAKSEQRSTYPKPSDLSASHKHDTAHELIKKYLPKSLPTTTKSYEPQVTQEKLLPLRHSLDKPQTANAVHPEPSPKPKDLSFKQGDVQTGEQISPTVLSPDTGSIKRTVNSSYTNPGTKRVSSSLSSNHPKKGTQPSYTEGQPYIPSFYTEIQAPNTRSARAKNVLSKNSIGPVRTTASAVLPDACDKLDVKPPPDRALCNGSLGLSLDSHKKSSTTTTSHFATTLVSPKLTRPQHSETDLTKLMRPQHSETDLPKLTRPQHSETDLTKLTRPQHSETDLTKLTRPQHSETDLTKLTKASSVLETMSQQLRVCSDDQRLKSNTMFAIDTTDKQSEAEMLEPVSNAAKPPPTIHTEAVSNVPAQGPEVVRKPDPSYGHSSLALQALAMNVSRHEPSLSKPNHPHHEKDQDPFSTTFQNDLSPLTKSMQLSTSPVSQASNSISFQNLPSSTVDSQNSNFKDILNFDPVTPTSDSDASTIQDDISEDSLSQGKNSKTHGTFSPTVSMSPESSSKLGKKAYKRRTSSPKPEPTRSTKYDHLQVAVTSPSQSPRRQEAQKYNRGRESFYLSNPSNDAQHLPMFRKSQDKAVESETSPLYEDSPSNSWSAIETSDTPRDSLELESCAETSETTKQETPKHGEFHKGLVKREQLGDTQSAEGQSISQTHMLVSHPPHSQMSPPPNSQVSRLPHSQMPHLPLSHMPQLPFSQVHHPQISQPQISHPKMGHPQVPHPQIAHPLVTHQHEYSSQLPLPPPNSSLQDGTASHRPPIADGAKLQDPATIRFSLEANLLVLQKGQLRSVQTRVAPPVLKAISEADDRAQISVASILKKALTDRRFAMRDHHDSAEFTPDASWSMQDDDL